MFKDLYNIYFLSSFPVNVYVPKDRVTNLHQGYGFVEFRSEEDADYVSMYILVHAFVVDSNYIHACCLRIQGLLFLALFLQK